MQPTSFRLATSSVASRLTLQVVAVLAAGLLIISALVTVQSRGSASELAIEAVVGRTQSVADAVDALNNTARDMMLLAYQPFRRQLADYFDLDAEAGHLKSWGMLLNGDYSAVDFFAKNNPGGVAAIYMRKGDDFTQVASSQKDASGERDTSPLAHDHPAYAKVLKGEVFTSRVVQFGKPYMAHYEPMKTQDGKVVGVLSVGIDIASFQHALDKLVGEARFHSHGAMMVINPGIGNADASFVVHPTAVGQKVLAAYPAASAALDAMRAAPQAVLQDAASLLTESGGRPWLVMRSAESVGWWVVAQVSETEAMASFWQTLYTFWALFAVATVVLGAVMFALVRRNVSRPLGELTSAVTTVAKGDLSKRFSTTRRDEIGRLVNEVEEMRQRFVDMMTQVRSATDSINTASAEIASGNQDLSARTEQAASNLQQTAASMEQLTSTVRQSADAARQANQLVASASETAVRGGQVVSEVVATMDQINDSSKKISDIIGVIDGIAFQTNILALNAAVEAARAGEQGRGFAVVAGEVRNLAQRSAEAAKEIKGLIGASVDRVETGSRLVAEAGQTMSEIVGSVQRVSDIIGEITAASGEQSAGIGQVNTAVSQLDQMTQQNAALVEQSAAAAESLKDQAQRLAQVVQVFRIEGASAGVPVAAPRTPPAPARTEPGLSKTPTVAAARVAGLPRPPAAPAPTRLAPPSPPATPQPVKVSASASAEGDWESF